MNTISGNLVLVLAVMPIAWLVVALVVLKLKAWQAVHSALALAVALSLAFFQAALPAAKIPGVVASGVAFALCPICLLVFAALFTYAVTVESGAMDVIRKGLGGSAAPSPYRRQCSLAWVSTP